MERWNIFARELEDILAAHGLRFGQLDDRVHIHREKVRRLAQSLHRPKSFPVLNTFEMDELILALRLTEYEVLRLRAAILATAIEEMLMDRIHQNDALTAAEQIFPIILNTMYNYSGGTGGLAVVKGRTATMQEDNEIDLALETALAAIDRATIALHLSRHVSSPLERTQRASQSRAGFEKALTELKDAEEYIKVTNVWSAWYDEAQKGLDAANERLDELGE